MTRVVIEPNEAYHAQKEYIGSSTLVEMVKSPKHFHAAWTGPSVEPTDAMVRGTLIHSLLLEQDVVKYVKRPVNEKGDLIRSNAKEYQEFLKANPGKIAVRPDDFDNMYEMLGAFVENKRAMSMIAHTKIEHSVYAICKETSLKIKARPDVWGAGYLVDLKSTSNMARFEKQIFELNYDVRLAQYVETIKAATGEIIEDVYFIAYESSKPYGSKIFRLRKDDLKIAIEKYYELLNQVSVCVKDNHWPCYGDDIVTIERPAYLESTSVSFGEVI